MHAVSMGGVDEVGLDQQVLVDEVGRVGVVGMDTTHPSGGQIDLVDALDGKKRLTAAWSRRSNSAWLAVSRLV